MGIKCEIRVVLKTDRFILHIIFPPLLIIVDSLRRKLMFGYQLYISP